jgi:glycine hydroxymethyltransferase
LISKRKMGVSTGIDPEVFDLIAKERGRQQLQINLIAAENYASKAVLEAQGSMLTNKYAEGYPQARYYAGCRFIDEVEELAIERAKRLFSAEHANVQPHSGSQANMTAYFALLQPGDTVMAMNLNQGGHLSHGSAVNFSGRLYHFVHYGVDRDTEQLDYDQIERLALEHRPKLIVAGASSYPRVIDFERFRHIADRVGAKFMADIAHIAGLVAVGLHPNPTPYAEVVTSTSHKTLRGPRGGFILSQAKLASLLDHTLFPGIQGGPLMHVIAAKAVAFHEAMRPEFVSYQKRVLENASILAEELQRMGLRPVSGGTDNHMVLVDLTLTGLSGKAAEEALEAVGIIVNRNAIPFDPCPPQLASGIRLGSPAVTSRGFSPKEMKQIAQLIVRTLSHIGEKKVYEQVQEEVAELGSHFPIPGIEE